MSEFEASLGQSPVSKRTGNIDNSSAIMCKALDFIPRHKRVCVYGGEGY